MTQSPVARAVLTVIAVLGTVAVLVAVLYVVGLVGAFALATPA